MIGNKENSKDHARDSVEENEQENQRVRPEGDWSLGAELFCDKQHEPKME